MTSKMFALLALFLVASQATAQKRPERPKIHSEFYFGSLPVSRDVTAIMARDEVRLLMVGLHQGWDLEKIAKETKVSIDDLSGLFADLEEQRLAEIIDEYENRPLLPVIREKDFDRIKDKLQSHTLALSKVLQSNWTEIESAVASFAGAKGVPKDQLIYQVVVGGILWGSMTDVFFEDQTLMPPPPRRDGSQRFYAWLIEGDSRLAGTIKREQWESEGHTVVAMGSSVAKDRMTVSQIRAANGMVLDEAESRRFRTFLTVFSRDKLLPFFKNSRSDLLASVRQFEAGKYARVADVFSWYYDQMANGAVEELIKAGRLRSPETPQAYATRAAQR